MAPRPDLGAPLAEWAAAEIRESLEDVLHCRRQLQESYASAPWASVHTAEYAAAKQARAVIRACIRAARTRLRTAEKDLFAACATSRVSGAPAPIASVSGNAEQDVSASPINAGIKREGDSSTASEHIAKAARTPDGRSVTSPSPSSAHTDSFTEAAVTSSVSDILSNLKEEMVTLKEKQDGELAALQERVTALEQKQGAVSESA